MEEQTGFPERFRIRERDGTWEVLVNPDTDGARWQQCDSKADADVIANAPSLFNSFNSVTSAEMAGEYEHTATILEKYGMQPTARLFRIAADSLRQRANEHEFNFS